MADIKKEDILENYSSTSTDITSKNYDTKVEEKRQFLLQNVLNNIKIKKEAKILDIGCGWGGSLNAFKKEGFNNLHGFDLSKEQVRYANDEGGLKNVIVSDAIEYMEQSTETFDLITMFDVLEHLENDYAIRLLTLINQKLSKGGKLIIQVPNGISMIQAYLYSDITHIHSFTTLSLGQILKMSGFKEMSFFESNYVAKTFKQKIAKYLFKFIFKPFTMLYIFSLTASKFDSIYTANILTIATK